MFRRRVMIEAIGQGRGEGDPVPCRLHWLDNFAMRNFTNDAIFDDTLPVADGVLEVGDRVPVEKLQAAMEDWFRRKGYLKVEEQLQVTEL